MSTDTVATPTAIQTKANNFWRFSLADDDRLVSSTNRRRPVSTHDGVTRRKGGDMLRTRNSWRHSWRTILSKPFNGQNGGLRGKNKVRKKSTGSLHDVAEESIENRKKMDELLRLWHSEMVDSSDESSDDNDECSPSDGRRSGSPRVMGNDTSSSEDDEMVLEAPVSLYVSEGPSRMTFPEPEIECDFGLADSDAGLSTAPCRESLEVELGGDEEQVNIARQALKGVQTPINHSSNNNVIAPLQIYDLERSSDSHRKLLPHTCCCLREHRAVNDKIRGQNDANVLGIHEERSPLKEYAKDDLEIGCHRSTWVNSRHVAGDLEGTIKESHKDRLSVSEENVALENEGFVNERANDYRSVGVESSKRQHCYRVSSDAMDGIFSAQELNAIRRFLGMSLQQIDTNKMLDKVEGTNTTTTVGAHGKGPDMKQEEPKVKNVVPDYPSTYRKNTEETDEKGISKEDGSELQCEFKQFGCQFAGTRCSVHLDDHMTSSIREHLTLVSKTATDQRRQLQQQRLLQENQGRLIRELRETVWNMKQMVDDQTKKNATQEKVVVSLKDQLREQRKQNQRFERDIAHQLQTFTQSASITSLPSSPSAAAEMLWPIKHFSKILRQVRDGEIDDPLVSESFYTGQYGYKLSLWVYLNGRGKNLGSCVSVYARIMPGEHDAILSWPVRPAYTFSLFDQSEGDKENIVQTRRINGIKRDGGRHQGIERPGGGDRAVIVGFDDFVAHDKLDKKNYLKDDCFYLKLDAQFLC